MAISQRPISLSLFIELTCPSKIGPGSELVLWQDLRLRGGQDEGEKFYSRADHQDASGGRGSSVSGQDVTVAPKTQMGAGRSKN